MNRLRCIHGDRNDVALTHVDEQNNDDEVYENIDNIGKKYLDKVDKTNSVKSIKDHYSNEYPMIVVD